MHQGVLEEGGKKSRCREKFSPGGRTKPGSQGKKGKKICRGKMP